MDWPIVAAISRTSHRRRAARTVRARKNPPGSQTVVTWVGGTQSWTAIHWVMNPASATPTRSAALVSPEAGGVLIPGCEVHSAVLDRSGGTAFLWGDGQRYGAEVSGIRCQVSGIGVPSTPSPLPHGEGGQGVRSTAGGQGFTNPPPRS